MKKTETYMVVDNFVHALSNPPKFSGNSRQRRKERRRFKRLPDGKIGNMLGFTFIK